MTKISIEFRAKNVYSLLNKMGDFKVKMEPIATAYRKRAYKNFAQRGKLLAEVAWLPRRHKYKHPLLIEFGRLRMAFGRAIGDNFFKIFNRTFYAPFLHFGTGKKQNVKGGGLPPRPLLGFNTATKAMIARLIQHQLEEAFAKYA